jgi:hypothetical protein
MEKYKLGALFSILSDEEWDLCLYFLKSSLIEPLASRKMDLLLAIRSYIQTHKHFSQDKSTGQALWELAFPDGRPEYNFDTFRNDLSDIATKLEAFLAVRSLLLSPRKQSELLIDILNQRAIGEKFLIKEVQAFENRYKADTITQVEDLYVLHRLQQTRYETEARNLQRAPNEFLPQMISTLDDYYFVKKLKYGIETLVQSNTVASPQTLTNDKILCAILDALQHRFASEDAILASPLLAIYYLAYQLYSTGSPSQYHELKQNLHRIVDNKNKYLLPRDEHIHILNAVQNYCIKQSNAGDREMLKEYLAWIEYRIEHDLMKINGYMTPMDLKNYISASLRVGKATTAKTFLEANILNVQEDSREVAYKYNRAHIYLYLRDFSAAKKELAPIGTELKRDPRDDLDFRSLQVKLMYELNEEGLEKFVENYQQWLRRNKTLPESTVIRHQNKLWFLNRIITAKDRETHRKILYDLKISNGPVHDIGWLFEILDNILFQKKG